MRRRESGREGRSAPLRSPVGTHLDRSSGRSMIDVDKATVDRDPRSHGRHYRHKQTRRDDPPGARSAAHSLRTSRADAPSPTSLIGSAREARRGRKWWLREIVANCTRFPAVRSNVGARVGDPIKRRIQWDMASPLPARARFGPCCGARWAMRAQWGGGGISVEASSHRDLRRTVSGPIGHDAERCTARQPERQLRTSRRPGAWL